MPRLLSPYGLTLAALALAAALGGCAAYVDRRADAREAAWEARIPPLGRLVEVDGRAVHVVEAGRARGTAPDVVLIHGAHGSLRDFTFDLVDRLAAEYRVIAVDRPGHGFSASHGAGDTDPRDQARILRRALEGYGLSRPIVVGHSYGGSVAMAWALEAEGATGAVVLLAGAVMPWEGDLGAFYRFLGSPLGFVGRGWIAGMVDEGRARTVTRRVFAPDAVPAGYADHFGLGLSMRRSALEANTRQLNALKDHLRAMQPLYARLTLPIEAVHGSADRTVGLAIHAQRLVAEVASARLTVLDGVGHMPHHARPRAVLNAIARAADRAGLR